MAYIPNFQRSVTPFLLVAVGCLSIVFLIPTISQASGAVDPQGTGEPKPVEPVETFVTPQEVESLGIPAPSGAPTTTTPDSRPDSTSPTSPVVAPEPEPEVPPLLLVETVPVEPTNTPTGSSNILYIVLATLAAVIGGGLAYLGLSTKKSKSDDGDESRCSKEKAELEAMKVELGVLGSQRALLEAILEEVKEKGLDALKGKGEQLLKSSYQTLKKRTVREGAKVGVALTGAEKTVSTFRTAKDAIDTIQEIIEAIRSLKSELESDVGRLESVYMTCMAGTVKDAASGAGRLVLASAKSDKVILVDAMGAFVYENEGIYEPLHKLLETYPNKKIVLTMAPDDLMEKWGLNNLPYEVYTSKRDPMKVNPQYYKDVLDHFKLKKEDVIYFEHAPEAVQSAQSLGIVSYFYDGEKRDLEALKKFIDSNL